MTTQETEQTILDVLTDAFANADEVDNIDAPELAATIAQALVALEKRRALTKALEFGSVLVHIDARANNVWVPTEYKGAMNLPLRLGYNLQPPIDLDLNATPWVFTARLSFNGRPFTCTIPWASVFGIRNEYAPVQQTDQIVIAYWPESIPREMLENVAQKVLAPEPAPEPTPAKKPRPAWLSVVGESNTVDTNDVSVQQTPYPIEPSAPRVEAPEPCRTCEGDTTFPHSCNPEDAEPDPRVEACGNYNPWNCRVDDSGRMVDPDECMVCGLLEHAHNHAVRLAEQMHDEARRKIDAGEQTNLAGAAEVAMSIAVQLHDEPEALGPRTTISGRTPYEPGPVMCGRALWRDGKQTTTTCTKPDGHKSPCSQ